MGPQWLACKQEHSQPLETASSTETVSDHASVVEQLQRSDSSDSYGGDFSVVGHRYKMNIPMGLRPLQWFNKLTKSVCGLGELVFEADGGFRKPNSSSTLFPIGGINLRWRWEEEKGRYIIDFFSKGKLLPSRWDELWPLEDTSLPGVVSEMTCIGHVGKKEFQYEFVRCEDETAPAEGQQYAQCMCSPTSTFCSSQPGSTMSLGTPLTVSTEIQEEESAGVETPRTAADLDKLRNEDRPWRLDHSMESCSTMAAEGDHCGDESTASFVSCPGDEQNVKRQSKAKNFSRQSSVETTVTAATEDSNSIEETPNNSEGSETSTWNRVYISEAAVDKKPRSFTNPPPKIIDVGASWLEAECMMPAGSLPAAKPRRRRRSTGDSHGLMVKRDVMFVF